MAGEQAVIYLDVDDEITSAASRVRSGEATRVALVVPPGSRVATSRMNFRLLARDATVHGRRLAIVAPDAPSRALAAAAGLEVFASVGEYEAAMTAEREARDAERAGAAAAAAAGAAAAGAAGATGQGATTGADAEAATSPETTTPAADGGPPAGAGAAITGAAAAAGAAAGAAGEGAAGPTAAGPTAAGATPPSGGPPGAAPSGPAGPSVPTGTGSPPPTPPPSGAPGPDALRPRSAGASAPPATASGTGRGFPVGPVAVIVAIVAVLAIVGGVAAYLLLPSATIVVTPKVQPLGPVAMTVTADPTATTVDIQNGVVPAETLSLDEQASGTYPATGKRVVEASATGSLRWQNCDPTASHTIPAGTVVSTRGGIRFTVDERVFLPVAIINLPSITCQTRDVGITAVKAGPEANVPAGTITVIPGALNSVVISATNPAPTTGGKRDTFPRITQADIDAAVKDLGLQLQSQFASDLKDPASAPSGLTVFPETGSLSDPTVTPDPQSLVGTETASFDLSATAKGSVTAVDEGPVSVVAAARLRATQEPGYAIVAGSVKTTIGEPRVEGEKVIFPATARGQEVQQLDANELKRQVLGMTEAEAQQTLSQYGTVTIELTPDWATSIPSFGFRVDLSIGETAPVESPSPGSSTGPSASPIASPSS
jgi:hypothetical protein